MNYNKISVKYFIFEGIEKEYLTSVNSKENILKALEEGGYNENYLQLVDGYNASQSSYVHQLKSKQVLVYIL